MVTHSDHRSELKGILIQSSQTSGCAMPEVPVWFEDRMLYVQLQYFLNTPCLLIVWGNLSTKAVKYIWDHLVYAMSYATVAVQVLEIECPKLD